MPTAIVALGAKFYVEDNTETPDTMQATFYYPKFLTTYESRTCNPMPMFGARPGRGHRHPRDRGDDPGQPQRLLADSQQHQNAGDGLGKEPRDERR